MKFGQSTTNYCKADEHDKKKEKGLKADLKTYVESQSGLKLMKISKDHLKKVFESMPDAVQNQKEMESKVLVFFSLLHFLIHFL